MRSLQVTGFEPSCNSFSISRKDTRAWRRTQHSHYNACSSCCSNIIAFRNFKGIGAASPCKRTILHITLVLPDIHRHGLAVECDWMETCVAMMGTSWDETAVLETPSGCVWMFAAVPWSRGLKGARVGPIGVTWSIVASRFRGDTRNKDDINLEKGRPVLIEPSSKDGY